MALELSETGERLMLQNLRRRFPSASAEQIERRLAEWRREGPGEEAADADGRPVLRVVAAS